MFSYKSLSRLQCMQALACVRKCEKIVLHLQHQTKRDNEFIKRVTLMKVQLIYNDTNYILSS